MKIDDHCQKTKQVLLGAPSVKVMDMKFINVLIGTLMSSNFCPHLIFKFGDLIEFSVLKD